MAQFERALKQLVEDPAYADTVSKDWNRLRTDYNDLEPQELILLMQVWNASGHPEALRFSWWNLCHCCCSTN
jgi:hypothetical protein